MTRKRNKKEILVPYDGDGNMLCFVDSWTEQHKKVEWRENKPFLATVVFKTITKGRSAVRGIFEDKHTGGEYTMFLTEFKETIPLLEHGEYTGKFLVVKRGANYGLVPIDANPLEMLAIAAEEA